MANGMIGRMNNTLTNIASLPLVKETKLLETGCTEAEKRKAVFWKWWGLKTRVVVCKKLNELQLRASE